MCQVSTKWRYVSVNCPQSIMLNRYVGWQGKFRKLNCEMWAWTYFGMQSIHVDTYFMLNTITKLLNYELQKEGHGKDNKCLIISLISSYYNLTNITIFHRPIAHTCIIAQPKLWKISILLPSLCKSPPPLMKNPNSVPIGTWMAKYGNIQSYMHSSSEKKNSSAHRWTN